MSWSAPTEWERWDPKQLLVCPYDQTHKIAVKRFQYHLIKCRKSHPEQDFVTCPFNAKHVMLRPSLRHHVASCPDRSVIEQYSFKGSTKDSDGFYFKGDTSLPGYCHQDWELQPYESWDDGGAQIPASQYQPHRNSQQSPSAEPNPVRDPLSMDPNERKNLKEQLRRQAVLATRGTGVQNNRSLSIGTSTAQSSTQPSNSSIYMYGVQQTQEARQITKVNAPSVSQPNRRPLLQAARVGSYGRGNGMLGALVSRNVPGRPTDQSCAVNLPRGSPNASRNLPGQLAHQGCAVNLPESSSSASRNSPGQLADQSCAVNLPRGSPNASRNSPGLLADQSYAMNLPRGSPNASRNSPGLLADPMHLSRGSPDVSRNSPGQLADQGCAVNLPESSSSVSRNSPGQHADQSCAVNLPESSSSASRNPSGQLADQSCAMNLPRGSPNVSRNSLGQLADQCCGMNLPESSSTASRNSPGKPTDQGCAMNLPRGSPNVSSNLPGQLADQGCAVNLPASSSSASRNVPGRLADQSRAMHLPRGSPNASTNSSGRLADPLHLSRGSPNASSNSPCATNLPKRFPSSAEVQSRVLAPSSSDQRLYEEDSQNCENSSSVSEKVGSASSLSQRTQEHNFQSSNRMNRTGPEQDSGMSVMMKYTSGQGVGRARLLAEARKNNFGGICSVHRATGLSCPPFGRGRGVLN